MFEYWGDKPYGHAKQLPKDLYIDKLCDKVEDLFRVEPKVEKPLHKLYKKAIIQYFKKLINDVNDFVGVLSKNRYLMTYPSDWTPEQVEYLRSLVKLSGMLGEHDHPDRLLMYSEGASILRALQYPLHSQFNGDIIKAGYKYLICDVGGSKVKMNSYIMKLPPGTGTNIKVEYRCDWDENYTKVPSRLPFGTQNLNEKCKTYLISKFFTFEYLSDQRRDDFEALVNNVTHYGIKV